MEKEGILVEAGALKEYGKSQIRIEALEKKSGDRQEKNLILIHQKQLGVILFEN